MSTRCHGLPSPRRGWQAARRLWRLVIAVWIGSWLAIAPALLLLRQVVVQGLASLPSGPGEVPAGDVALIVLETVRGAARPLVFAVLSGLALLWAWTVLWHAGVVAWTLRRRRWRFAATLARPGRVVALRPTLGDRSGRAAARGGGLAGWSRRGPRREAGPLLLLGIGVVATKLTAIAVWLATLHGSWLLGVPGRRSAVAAWLRGLQVAVHRPLASLGAWLVWVVPALLVSAAARLMVRPSQDCAADWCWSGSGCSASLLRAFCWVNGLFSSFAR
jgi:hypothetical protein